MAFSQSSITEVTIQPDGSDLIISWESVAPYGTMYQVYVDRRLCWFGRSTRCHVPIPVDPGGPNVWVDVGTVDGPETYLDFSASLSSLGRGGDRLELDWSGGTYLDPTGRDDFQGFRVYSSPGPGIPVDPSKPVADITAYPGGWISDGFGLGGFGLGGFGRSATAYAWNAGVLSGGVWQFRIVPYDRSGTERGDGQTVSMNVSVAPAPPARGVDGRRLRYVYSSPATRRVMLQWLPSPSAS
jgi:hypothetical protein